MMLRLRFLLIPAFMALAACRADTHAPLPPLPPLATFRVDDAGGRMAREWDGVVEAVRRADLTAQTAGSVTAVVVDVNDRVQAGDVLLRISAMEQEAGANAARAQWRAAQANAVEAEQNYKRYAALEQANYVSKAQIDQARAARDAAIAARNAAAAVLAQANQQAAYTVVRAPYAGIVAKRNVEPGETVAPGMPLMSVYAPGALRIEVVIPQTQAAAVRKTPSAQVRLADGRVVTPVDVIVFPAADPQSHSVNVRLNLPALAPAPTPGTTAKVQFAAGVQGAAAGKGLVQIPVKSLVQRGELTGVYVVAGNHLLLRQLRLGARMGERVDVIAGLQVGEQVASDPVAAVQALIAQRQQREGAGSYD